MSMIDHDDIDRLRDEAEARKKRLAAAVPPVPPRETTAVRRDDPEAVIRRLRASLATSRTITTASEPCVSRSEAETVVKAFNDAPPVDGRRWHGGVIESAEDAKGTFRAVVYLVNV